jgi:glutaredoxin 2
LTSSVHRLGEIEQALKVLTNTQGQSFDAFQKQVADNQQILSQMKNNVQANVLQNLLSVVSRGDTNQDVIMNDMEITTLLMILPSARNKIPCGVTESINIIDHEHQISIKVEHHTL